MTPLGKTKEKKHKAYNFKNEKKKTTQELNYTNFFLYISFEPRTKIKKKEIHIKKRSISN